MLQWPASYLIGHISQYMLFFGMTANCIPWVYVPEIVPLHARSKGTAIGISSNWLWNFFVVMITPTLITNIKWKAYLIFMCTNLAYIPLIYFFFPETNNLTLEEIDWLFLEKDPVKMSRTVAKHGWPEDSVWSTRLQTLQTGVPEKELIGTHHDEEK